MPHEQQKENLSQLNYRKSKKTDVVSSLLVTNLLRGAILLHGLCLCCCPILISPTYVQHIVAAKAAVTSEYIST